MRRYGVPVHVNEFDVNMKDVPGTQEERFAKQAEIYRDMLQAALESGVCTNFMLFGFGDRYSWLELDKTQAAFSPNADPTPFDDNLKPKPCLLRHAGCPGQLQAQLAAFRYPSQAH